MNIYWKDLKDKKVIEYSNVFKTLEGAVINWNGQEATEAQRYLKQVSEKAKKYAVSFTGRQRGAIGIFYRISDFVELPEGATKEEITLKLYEKYEHISKVQLNN